MAAVLRIVDEHFGGSKPGRVPAMELRLVSERVSAGEIIRRRVEAEVEALNDARQRNDRVTRSFLIWTDDGSAEAVLNTKATLWQKPKPIDAGQEVARALTAFSSNRFVMLFNDRQLEALDEEVGLTQDSEIVFLFLTPLKGG